MIFELNLFTARLWQTRVPSFPYKYLLHKLINHAY